MLIILCLTYVVYMHLVVYITFCGEKGMFSNSGLAVLYREWKEGGGAGTPPNLLVYTI